MRQGIVRGHSATDCDALKKSGMIVAAACQDTWLGFWTTSVHGPPQSLPPKAEVSRLCTSAVRPVAMCRNAMVISCGNLQLSYVRVTGQK